MAHRKLGLWLIGAAGSVGSSVALGLAALRSGLIDSTGLVTALPNFAPLPLVAFDQIVLGGHDLSVTNLANAARRVGGIRPAYSSDLIEKCQPQLTEWTANLRAGANWHIETALENWSRITADLNAFRDHHRLDHVVVVNLASAEPETPSHPAHHDVTELQRVIHAGTADALASSSWYAAAAISCGCSYVNFTASTGASLPALESLATKRQVALAGQDGKTGETLLKTVLAPMFAQRNLKVLSWIGHNLLGNNDGRVLSDPARRTAKLKNKDRVVADILGYAPESLTGIEFVESLDDWKTAWDHVHFQGFLNVPMTLQFTWQGCDSALAAPLVVDLARLTDFAFSRGEYGVLPHLSLFFKAPQGGGSHDFHRQWQQLVAYAAHHCAVESQSHEVRL
jgi:myo-inositol-1-phosphate synthase